MLGHERGVARIALNFSQRRDSVLFNPRLLVTARALKFFGQELRLVLRPTFFLAPPPTFLSLSFVDIKAGGRKEGKKVHIEAAYVSGNEKDKKKEEVEERGRQSAET